MVSLGLGFAFSLSRLPNDATRKAAIAKIDEFLGLYAQSALAAKALDRDLADIARENIEKLTRRYPNGFEQERSIHREE